MDFFKEFGDLSSTPIYPKYKQQSSQQAKSVKFAGTAKKSGKDDFDDLLDNLMSKDQMRKSKRNIEPYSSQYLTSVDPLGKTTQKFPNAQTDSDFNLNYGLSKDGNKASKKSMLDDLMSEDNKSYRSGATGRRDYQPTESMSFMKNFQLPRNQTSEANVGGRAAMRPPLKKKESKQPSFFNDDNKSVSRANDNWGSTDDLQIMSMSPKNPRRNNMLQADQIKEQQQAIKFEPIASKNQLFKPMQVQISRPQTNPPSSSVIQQKIIQKVVHVKEDNKELTARHQEQIKLIKQSYERQLGSLKENYEKIIKQEQQNRKTLMKTYEQSGDIEKRKWQKTMKDETERIKSLYEWQMKRKTEGYELEIKKLRQLLDTVTKSHMQNTSQSPSQASQHQSHIEITIKLKQLQQQRQRLQQQKLITQTKRRQLQTEEHQFDLYRRREENKMNDERKKLFQYETETRKRQVELKKEILSEKQSIAAEMVNGELTLAQARENIRHENQKLNLQRELFAQQKMEYEKINSRILADLKQRQKILQAQKQQVHQLQVQLYKKINTIEMMAVEKGLMNNRNTIMNTTMNRNQKRSESVNRSLSVYEENHKENNRNRINSQLDDKIAQTKSRYAQMQNLVRSNSVHREANPQATQKIHLDKYIDKLTKDKLKLQKY